MYCFRMQINFTMHMFDQSSWIPIRWVYFLINCELRVSLLLNELSFMLKEFAYSSIYVYKYIYI